MKIKLSSFSVLILLTCGAGSFLTAGIYDNSPEFIYPELRSILKQAEVHSHQYETMDINLANAKLNKGISLANRRPNLNLSTGAGAFWSSFEDIETGETEGIKAGINDLSLSSYYSLFTWGAKRAGHRIAEKSYQNFLIDYERQMSSLAKNIRTKFLNLIIQKFSLRTLELSVAITNANIDQDNIRHEQGKLSNDNYTRSMNSRKLRLIDLEKNKRDIERSIIDFNNTIGVNVLTLQNIPSSIPKAKNVNELLISIANQSESRNFSDNPRVQKSQLALDIAEEAIISTKSRTLPSVGLSAGLTLDIEPTQGNQRVWQAKAGLGIGWNIYSGGANSKRMMKSLNQRTSKLSNHLELLKNTKIAMDRSIEDLLYRYSRLEISESEYQLALQAYEKSKDEYDRGRISDLHFQHVELGRLNQEKSIFNARKDYVIIVSDFLSMLGKDPILEILTRPEEKDLSYLRDN